VTDAAVVAVDSDGDTRLVAHVVRSAAGTGVDLRAWLAERLPAHLVPSAVVSLPALPLTANGKVDRTALAAARQEGEGRPAYEPPAGVLEEALGRVWAELLGVERVGAADGFFDLGGHSLLATRLVARVAALVGVRVPLRSLFEAPTLRGFAAVVDRALAEQLDALDEAAIDAILAEEDA
jgi:hypothetical protein